MKLLFYLGHPAHFHLFRHTILRLKSAGHEVIILARKKDVLEDLLRSENLSYVNVMPRDRSQNLWGMLQAMLTREWAIFRHAIAPRPALMLGSCPEIGHIGTLLRIPSIVVNEDDNHVIPRFAKLAYPFCTHILAPRCCQVGKWEHKAIRYSSYHELAYLHPNHFEPDRRVVDEFHSSGKPYFILRFAKLTAHHDVGRKGIDAVIARRLVHLLEKKGTVYITSERELEPEFEPYRIQLDPSKIHHAMAFATLYVGDSQTMAAEAAVLGTPAIRFNDFVGEIGYLEELEKSYGLTYGVRTSDPERMLQLVDQYSNPGEKAIWGLRRHRMLEEKVDFAAFMTWLVENYPGSVGKVANEGERFCGEPRREPAQIARDAGC
jgi:uncharacterized protein